MALSDGTYEFGSDSGTFLLRTGRAGLGARAGHDLTIEATGWRGTATVVADDPARSSVTVEVDVESLRVREGTGGIKALTDSDRAEIEKTIANKLLLPAKHPTIAFESTRVAGSAASLTVTGNLTIKGETRPVTVTGSVSDDGRVQATATVVQSQWGIKPYSALLGALRVADEVAIEVDATLSAS